MSGFFIPYIQGQMTEGVKTKCCYPNSRRFQFGITSKNIGTSITHLLIRS